LKKLDVSRTDPGFDPRAPAGDAGGCGHAAGGTKTAYARPKSSIANVHDRLEPYVAKLNKAGLEQLQPVERTRVGRDTRFRDLDGLIVEYVEHDAGS
jgi:hypothetical protein